MIQNIWNKFANKFKSTTVILICILAFGFFIRIYQLDRVPAGFFCDEAVRGVDAYSLLTTGKDSNNAAFPIFFKVFGEYTPPLQTYSEMIPIFLFGLNEISVRLVAVICGTICILLTYLIAKILFNKRLGFIAAIVFAITPWTLHYSRTGFEYNIYLVFFLASLCFWLFSIKNPRYIIIAYIFWGLTFYTYNPAKLLVWVFLLGLLVFTYKHVRKKIALHSLGLILFLIISTPLIFDIFYGNGLVRFQQVSILSAKLDFHQIIWQMTQNYFHHFSFDFLSLKGDPTFISRHFTGGLTPLLLTMLPFLIIGLIVILKKPLIFPHKLLLFWLFAYPLSGTFTHEIGTNRAIIGVSLTAIIIALGISSFANIFSRYIHRKSLYPQLFCIILLLINFLFFYRFYLTRYPLYSSDYWGWQYGPREIMKYFLQEKNRYDDLYMSGEFNGSDIFLKFYDPKNVCDNKCKIGDFWREPNIYNPSKKQLFSLSPEYLNNSTLKEKFLVRKTIHYPNNTIAFLIGEIVQ